MKKTIVVLCALLPVIYVLSLLFLFLQDASDAPLLTFMIIYCVAAAVLHVLFCILTATSERKFLAACNIWLHVGNLLLFIFEAVYWFVQLEQTRIAEQNGAMGGGLGLVLLILLYLPHWFSYFLTHITATINCSRTLQGICTGGVCALLAGLQLLPVTDILSAGWVLRIVKSNEKTA
jgi:hypothetical protein